jgi:hypothetical protein
MFGWILFILDIYEFNRHRSVHGEYGHQLQNRGPSDWPQKNGDFLENSSDYFD